MQDFLLSFGNGNDNENDSIFPSLSLKERLIGFAICFGLGMLFQFMSMGSIVGVLVGRPNKFAFLYTCGNIISIFGTFFLIGPVRQFKNMTNPYRRKASMIFLSAIVLTFISLYILHSKILTVLFVIIQFGAYIYYIMSYIPYGQQCLNSLVSRFFGTQSN